MVSFLWALRRRAFPSIVLVWLYSSHPRASVVTRRLHSRGSVLLGPFWDVLTREDFCFCSKNASRFRNLDGNFVNLLLFRFCPETPDLGNMRDVEQVLLDQTTIARKSKSRRDDASRRRKPEEEEEEDSITTLSIAFKLEKLELPAQPFESAFGCKLCTSEVWYIRYL